MTNEPDLAALAMSALGEGRMADAARHFQEIVDRVPGESANWFNLGFARRGARDFSGALEAYSRALALGGPRPHEVLVNRAVILKDDLGRMEEAEAELKRATEIAPKFAPAWFNLGLLYEVMGRREQALGGYRTAVAAAPMYAQAVARLAALQEDPQRAIGQLVDVLRRGRFSQEDAGDLEYALGNALDRAHRYEEAFGVISKANARKANLRRAQFRYDAAAHERLVDALIAGFPKARSVSAAGTKGRPLFICGMFRSGSTVTEQWLAQHPRIAAGGELETIPIMVRELLQPYPEAAVALTGPRLGQLRREYLRVLDEVAPGAQHATDKRCDNFLHIGLIKSLFPDAVMVHTVREPLDIAISTYFLDFAEPISYTTSLPDIGHYLAQYRRLMTHWEQVFRDDIVTVEYERLVVDPQAVLAPVFARLGLGESALTGEIGDGAIRTPSAWAARAPLNTKSIGRWRHYAGHLEPVRSALGLQSGA